MPISGYFDTVFATGGDRTAVPDPTQPGGTVSYEQGYSISYSTPVASGGYDFPRNQHNQILYDITSAIQYLQQNGAPPFITTAMNGGGGPFSYIIGALVSYDAGSGLEVWVSTAAANTTTPGAGGAHWVPLTAPSSPLFIGGTSTGSANAQAIATNQGTFANTAGNIVTFKAGISNTSASTLTVDSVNNIPLKVISTSGLRDTQQGDIVSTGEYIGISDGTNIQILNPTVASFKIVIQKFTTSGTYTPTSGMFQCKVRQVGGGGGSAGGTGASQICGAGAAGYLEALLTAAQIGSSQAVTIGAGGTAGTSGPTDGGTGGTTSLGSLLSCTGGAPSTGASIIGGAGGAPTISTGTEIFKTNGQQGGCAFQASAGWSSGTGGSNPMGYGGPGVQINSGGIGIAGTAGVGYGAGAGGAATNGVNAAGAAGTVGYMVIEEWVQV